MSSLVAGKVVCITGSSRGIGRACAVEFAKHGATGLVLHYYGDEETTKEIQTLKQEIEGTYSHAKVTTIPGDIADPKTSTTVSRYWSLIRMNYMLIRLQIISTGVSAFGRIGNLPLARAI